MVLSARNLYRPYDRWASNCFVGPNIAEVVTDPPSAQTLYELQQASRGSHSSDEEIERDHIAEQEALISAARPKQVNDALKGLGGLMVGLGAYSSFFSTSSRREDYGVNRPTTE